MFFNNKRRVEEDLKRIRRANMSPEALEKELAEEKRLKEAEVSLTPKDILAMTIAAFEVLLPYVLTFIALLIIIYLLIF